jgi:hypothetical protein
MKSDDFRNLRAGPIIEAGAVKDSTVRAWIRNNGLEFGDRKDRDFGNPRYGLVDAARLTMMRFLVERLKMPAGPAVATTNFASVQLAILSERELAAIDNPGNAPDGKRMVMLLDRVDGLHQPEILDHRDVMQREGNRGLILETRIDLREIVRMARDRLAMALGQSTSGFRHDFVDAPFPDGGNG